MVKWSNWHFSFNCSTGFPAGRGQRLQRGRPALTVHRHFIDLGGVVLLNVSQDADVIVLHKVDRYTFSAVSARPANSAQAEGRENAAALGQGNPAPLPPVKAELTCVCRVLCCWVSHS